MRDRQLVSLSTIVAGVLGVLAFAGTVMVAQAPSSGAAAKSAPAPRTPWGTPDLQGTWFVTEDVPLQRSAANEGREFLTDEEVAALDKQKAANQGRNTRAGNAGQDVEGAYNAVFNSILKTGRRTSRIIDPPDGRIPTIDGGRGGPAGRGAAAAPPGAGAPGAQAPGRGAPGAAAAGARGGRGGRGAQTNDNPEQIAQNPRCLGVTAPFLPLNTSFAQGTVMRIVQSRTSVAIYLEDDHAGGGNRIINLDGRPRPPASLRFYLGDSRGRWEGDTLVIETTNFASGFQGSTADLRMIERYRRVDANNLRREITFEDPKVWTRPWTVLIELGKVEDERHMIFESACHEGNYGLTSILVGARMEEKAAAGK